MDYALAKRGDDPERLWRVVDQPVQLFSSVDFLVVAYAVEHWDDRAGPDAEGDMLHIARQQMLPQWHRIVSDTGDAFLSITIDAVSPQGDPYKLRLERLMTSVQALH